MSFAAEYLAQLEAFAARGLAPQVRALHLPPSREMPENKGEFCALELEDGSIGLSYVLLGDTLEELRAGVDSAEVHGADALRLARCFLSDTGARKTLGFAAANALTRCLFDRAGFRPGESSDSLGHLHAQPGEHIGMIGKFTPLLGRIIASRARLTIVELKAELVGDYDGYRVTLDPEQLADCDKVVSTSTLLLNDTLDRMLGCCRSARWFAMVGPGAGCLPDALFSRGVTLLGGSWIMDGKGFIAALKSGASHSAFTSKFALTADNYPGFAALLERADG
jgi:uncharacterized protein (DUF4213/DUF364 family)